LARDRNASGTGAAPNQLAQNQGKRTIPVDQLCIDVIYVWSQFLSNPSADLGGAVRLVAAAPFWDDGSAIDRLCAAIGLDHLFVHSHPYGNVEGFAGSNWPTGCRNKVHAIHLDLLNAQGEPRQSVGGCGSNTHVP
jgi:hypothetical protein